MNKIILTLVLSLASLLVSEKAFCNITSYRELSPETQEFLTVKSKDGKISMPIKMPTLNVQENIESDFLKIIQSNKSESEDSDKYLPHIVRAILIGVGLWLSGKLF